MYRVRFGRVIDAAEMVEIVIPTSTAKLLFIIHNMSCCRRLANDSQFLCLDPEKRLHWFSGSSDSGARANQALFASLVS